MRRILLILLLLLLATQALALESGSFEIIVTINKAPNIENFRPEDGYRITEGDILEILVTANDPNNDILQYQYYINNNIKQPWTTKDSFSCTLTSNDIGMNIIKVEVTDGLDTVQTKEVQIYVFRRPLDLPTI